MAASIGAATSAALAVLHWLVPAALALAVFVRMQTDDEDDPQLVVRARRLARRCAAVAGLAWCAAALADLLLWTGLAAATRLHHALLIAVGAVGMLIYARQHAVKD